ncbi:uncharacterized protein LOC113501256 [Trichoplusia ni]|uniref:U5 small nuclear ribonucleoprotein TSSC4 n=1 Tax=Trichoplusia ni TaxID=7111 RepID=A0A7E5WBR2_TRINI|nr:uncharacterized protein LOC113501256 [Trichoplusia ni]XP_026738140.1 uncharacterized protein LOC113501256 [Trichoplusia ni]
MSSFQERQKSLFNQLKVAEEEIGYSKTNKATPQDYGTIDKYTYKKLKHEMKQFRGRESIYKRPEANIRECLRAKTIPDHIKNPQKYKYYSLADVTPEQMSDSTNTATALALIREMEEKEAAASKMEHDADDTDVFKKPTFHISSALRKTPKAEEKAVFKSSKLIMPEYVVGVSKTKEKKVKRDKTEKPEGSEKKSQLKLDHLFEEED